MSLSHVSRRWAASLALVSYLLAATVSGMFHNHGDACCASGRCTAAAEPKQAACRHSHRKHNADHSSDEFAAASRSSNCPARPSDRQPSRHGPLRHSDCAACQFLAEQSITTPRIVLVATEVVAPHVSDAVDMHVSTVVADAHPPRGPPGRG